MSNKTLGFLLLNLIFNISSTP